MNDSTAVSVASAPSVNPWDNKVLTFDALNPKLPGQIYATCDGQARHAIRGDTVGSRAPMAPLVAFDPPREDGTDYALTEDQFTPGFVVLPGDAALFAAAEEAAKTGSFVTAPARGIEAEIVNPLSDAPDAPVATGATDLGGEQPAHAPKAVVEQHEAPAEVVEVSWLTRAIQTVERDAVAGKHAVESEVGAAWEGIKRVLGHG